MKKILVLIICILLGVQTATAQKGKIKIPDVGRAVERPPHERVRRYPSKNNTSKNRPPKFERKPTYNRREAFTGTQHPKNPVTGSHPRLGSSRPPSQGAARSTTTQPVQSRVTSFIAPRTSYAQEGFKLEPVNKTPERFTETARSTAPQVSPNAPLSSKIEENKFISEENLRHSVLLAPMEQRNPYGDVVPGGYTVPIIKITYKGEEEIFGVIATHTIPTTVLQRRGMLGRKFKVQAEDPWSGENKLFDAEVVAFSPSSMLDISLVKFDEEVEYTAVPLELADLPAIEGETLFTSGYGAAQPVVSVPRTVKANSFISIRTDQRVQGSRQGLCGSPLLDATGKVKGIHTGTKSMKGDIPDVSYATHAKFVKLLIDAYHNEGKATYDLEIDGHALAHLNVDEYVDYIAVYNSEGKLVAQKNIATGTADAFPKFSESTLRRLVQDSPDAAYLLLRTRAKQWTGGGTALVNVKKWNGKKNIDPTKRDNWYNLQTNQIENSRPDIIIM